MLYTPLPQRCQLAFVALHVMLVFQDTNPALRLARRETDVSPQVNYFYRSFQGGASFVDHLFYFCIVFVMLPCAYVY